MKILTLNDVTNICGYFNSDTRVNNGFGCSHENCGDRDLMIKINGFYDYVSTYNEIGFIAKKMTNRKIKCNRRLAKKYIKKAKVIQHDNEKLKRYGLFQAGKCFSFSCPIAYEINFDELADYENADEYDHIQSEDEMPQGFGDELMSVIV